MVDCLREPFTAAPLIGKISVFQPGAGLGNRMYVCLAWLALALALAAAITVPRERPRNWEGLSWHHSSSSQWWFVYLASCRPRLCNVAFCFSFILLQTLAPCPYPPPLLLSCHVSRQWVIQYPSPKRELKILDLKTTPKKTSCISFYLGRRRSLLSQRAHTDEMGWNCGCGGWMALGVCVRGG